MNFIELKHKRGAVAHVAPDTVRYVFRKNKRKGKNYYWYMLAILLGKNKAEEAGIKVGDKVKLFYDEENPRIWLIKKSIDGRGLTVGERPSSPSIFTLQIVWNLSVPDDNELLLKEVKAKPYQGGILIGDYRDETRCLKALANKVLERKGKESC